MVLELNPNYIKGGNSVVKVTVVVNLNQWRSAHTSSLQHTLHQNWTGVALHALSAL